MFVNLWQPTVMMILLASDSLSCCNRWRKALTGKPVLHQVNDQLGLRNTVREFRPALVILDYDSKRFRKTLTIRDTLRLSRETRIIALTDRPSAEEAANAIGAGARGYYSKKLSPGLLAKAAQVVNQGELWVSRKTVASLIDKLAELNSASHDDQKNSSFPRNPAVERYSNHGLSARESEIAALVCTGMANKPIAHQLKITERTVKAHLTQIFRKLNLTSRTQLIANLARTANQSGSANAGADANRNRRS